MPDLPRLHAQMDHVARTLWDIQKTRVTISNRVGRLEARMEAAGLVGLVVLDDGDTVTLDEGERVSLQAVLQREEDRLNRKLARLAKQHPLAPWVEQTRGIGLPGFARLMGLCGTLDRFPNPAKLWKFLGLHVADGRSVQRRRGVAWTHTDCKGGHLSSCPDGCTTNHHKDCRPGVKGTAYSPMGRVVCHQIAESIVKVGGPYRILYDNKKAEYAAREPVGLSGCRLGKHHTTSEGRTMKCPNDGHVHQAAMKFAVKRLILDMWKAWRVYVPAQDGPESLAA